MSRERFFILLLVVTVLCGTIIAVDLGVTAHRQAQRAEMYKDKFLEAQNNYEGTRDQLESAEQAVADRDERLAQAAERDRARTVRASRSRRTTNNGSQKATTVPKRQDSFSGALHDITEYCPTGGRTASGKWPREGMVATISRAIPFGTRVQIDGLGVFVVEDRIGHGSEFDIFTNSCSEAERFGRQHRAVKIGV